MEKYNQSRRVRTQMCSFVPVPRSKGSDQLVAQVRKATVKQEQLNIRKKNNNMIASKLSYLVTAQTTVRWTKGNDIVNAAPSFELSRHTRRTSRLTVRSQYKRCTTISTISLRRQLRSVMGRYESKFVGSSPSLKTGTMRARFHPVSCRPVCQERLNFDKSSSLSARRAACIASDRPLIRPPQAPLRRFMGDFSTPNKKKL